VADGIQTHPYGARWDDGWLYPGDTPEEAIGKLVDACGSWWLDDAEADEATVEVVLHTRPRFCPGWRLGGAEWWPVSCPCGRPADHEPDYTFGGLDAVSVGLPAHLGSLSEAPVRIRVTDDGWEELGGFDG
jgi:hypothetical protein